MDVVVKAQPSWRRGGFGGGSLAAQQGSQQKHSCHRRPGQEPFVEGLLALPHLGSSIVPIEVHKPLLWEERSCEQRGWEQSTETISAAFWGSFLLCGKGQEGCWAPAGRKAVVGMGRMTDALCFLALNHAQRAMGKAQDQS